MFNVHAAAGVNRSKLFGMLPFWEHKKKRKKTLKCKLLHALSLSLYFCDYIMTLHDIFAPKPSNCISISPFSLGPHSLLLQLEFALSTCMERQSLFLKLFRKPGCFKQLVSDSMTSSSRDKDECTPNVHVPMVIQLVFFCGFLGIFFTDK